MAWENLNVKGKLSCTELGLHARLRQIAEAVYDAALFALFRAPRRRVRLPPTVGVRADGRPAAGPTEVLIVVTRGETKALSTPWSAFAYGPKGGADRTGSERMGAPTADHGQC